MEIPEIKDMSLDKTSDINNNIVNNSYLISLNKSIITSNETFKIFFYLHKQQHIGIAIYNSPPLEMRKIILGDSLFNAGYHYYTINTEDLQPNKFYWLKLATEGEVNFVGRDFLSQFYIKG